MRAPRPARLATMLKSPCKSTIRNGAPPAAFNSTDEIEISRRITRDMGSTYKHNGKEIRARDAQTLFADAATGSNSPALVRQGQISELINAKPKARRRILEDAAGVAGLHARRHEALLRLNSAETNLQRVVEVLTQLEAREAALGREATRAKRYRTLSLDLGRAEAMLLFRRWREADRENTQARDTMERTVQIAAEATRLAAEAARKRLEFEEATPKLREEDAVSRAIHQKLMMERQALEAREREALATADRLARQLQQLEADLERETTIDADAAEMLEKLTAEYEALAEMDSNSEAIATAQGEERAAETALAEVEAELDKLTGEAARIGAELEAAHARSQESGRLLAKLEQDAAEARDRQSAIDEELETAVAGSEEAAMTAESAQEAIAAADEAASEAEAARAEAQERAQTAGGATAEARGAVKALQNEIEKLDKLLGERETARKPLLDQVRAAPGFEGALAAAVGDELQSGDADENHWGWVELPPLSPCPKLPGDAKPLTDFVSAPDALARRMSQTGLVRRELGFTLQERLSPGQRLVSAEGDVWRWDGFSASSEEAPPAAALRLQQQNRLEGAREELAESEAKLEALEEEQAAAKEMAEAAEAAERKAREDRRRAEQEAAAAARAASQAEAAIAALKSKRESLEQLAAERQQNADDARNAQEEAAATLERLADPAAAREAAEHKREQVNTARANLVRLRSAREAMEGQSRQRTERMDVLTRDRQSWTQRLAEAGAQRRRLEDRQAETQEQLEEAKAAPEQIAERREELAARLEEAESRRTRAVDALAEVETGLREATKAEKEAEAKLGEAREGRARLEARAEAAKERAEELSAALLEKSGSPPEEFLEKFELDPEALPLVKDLEKSIVRLRQERDKLGAVNLRADQELAEVSAERETLAGEREELDAAIAKLRQGVNALNKEGRERMLAAFDEVNRNFTTLFKHLFDGGDARLELVESDDPLEAGLEIMCQPPGKRLATLSLLSGGEQTLTAISLIFAVFMVNPAPICVLDEVDAPLDDANVARFCGLLDEMTRRTQTRFLIITHHAVSMSRMDRLFGVTMVEKGVSQLVSVDLETAVELVDA